MKISKELKERFKKASSIAVLTGAGISAESGVPTFRGSGETSAVWKGMPFDQISSAKMVRENLGEVWEWFDYRRDLLKNVEPNPAHFAIAEWSDHFEELTLLTQNVDGLHSRAGFRDPIEVHGNINRSRCVNCSKRFQMDETRVPHWPEMCDSCGGELRPDVVLFGEMLPTGAYETGAKKAAVCEMFFVVGTSAVVYPAAMLPEIAVQNGAYLVEVNTERTPLTEFCDESIQGKAGEILPILSSYLDKKS